jgi:glycosyltransferase involved in cell wall biosynthesis
MTIHFIYAKGNRISTPNAITNEVYKRLLKLYKVKLYNLDEQMTIYPEKGDILLGHANEWKKTIFKQSMKIQGWGKVIMMSPYHHNIPKYFAILDNCYEFVDVYLAITGKYWFDTMKYSLFSHWYPISRIMNLAVNRGHFPFVKTVFTGLGQRKFLYIGSKSRGKGTDYLLKLIKANPNINFGWIGYGMLPAYKNLLQHGVLDTTLDETRDIIKTYDYLITTGRSDANPTTILEAAAWGLIPVCTKESGYYEDNWIFNIPLNDINGASERLSFLNNLPEEKLVIMQKNASKVLDEKYNWDVFTDNIISAIESPLPLKNRLTIKQKINRLYLKLLFSNKKIKDKFQILRNK